MERATGKIISELKKQKRENKSLLFLDNVKIIKDALTNKTINPEFILTTEEALPFNFDGKIYKVTDSVLKQLSDTKTPQKVLCIAYYTQHVVKIPKSNFLVLDSLQDPGNVGSLIRTAKAVGFESVFLLDSVKISNPKLIRSSVGTVLGSNIYEMTKGEFVKFAQKNKLKIICCDMNGENIFEFRCNDKIGVVVGNEGQGASEEIHNLCYKTVKIPMKEGVESLNASVSGSIVMYEIMKSNF